MISLASLVPRNSETSDLWGWPMRKGFGGKGDSQEGDPGMTTGKFASADTQGPQSKIWAEVLERKVGTRF